MSRTPPSASEVKRRTKERIDAQLHGMKIKRAWDNLSDEQRAEIDRQFAENAPKALTVIAQRDTTFRKFQLNYLSQLAHLDYERSKIGKRKEFGNLIWVFRTLGVHASFNVDPPAWAMEALMGISKQIFGLTENSSPSGAKKLKAILGLDRGTPLQDVQLILRQNRLGIKAQRLHHKEGLSVRAACRTVAKEEAETISWETVYRAYHAVKKYHVDYADTDEQSVS